MELDSPDDSCFVDTLPDELLSRIFTIGSDDNFQALRRDHSIPSTGSVTPFIANASRVCRRWYALTTWRSNAHLRICFAYLNLHYDHTNDMAPSFASFHSAITTSRGRDLYADIRIKLASWSDPVSPTATKFLLLAIHLLRRYKNQLCFINVEGPEDSNLTNWLHSLLQEFLGCPRLWGVQLRRDDSLPIDYFDEAQNPPLPDKSFYGFVDPDPDWENGDRLPTASYLSLSLGRNSIGSQSTFPFGPWLRYLELHDWASADAPCSWNFLSQVLDRCRSLETLRCDLLYVVDVPTTFNPDIHKILISKLEEIDIYIDRPLLLHFLRIMKLPWLKLLTLHVRDPKSDEIFGSSETSEWNTRPLNTPLLMDFQLSSTSELGNKFLSKILRPWGLTRFRSCKALTVRGYHRYHQKDIAADLTSWISPAELTIEYWESITECLDTLAGIRLHATESLTLTVPLTLWQAPPEPETDRDRAPLLREDNYISAPSLRFIRIEVQAFYFPLTGTLTILDRLKAPVLKELRVVRRGIEELSIQFEPRISPNATATDLPRAWKMKVEDYIFPIDHREWMDFTELELAFEAWEVGPNDFALPAIAALSRTREEGGVEKVELHPNLEVIRIRYSNRPRSNWPDLSLEYARMVAIRIECGTPLRTVEVSYPSGEIVWTNLMKGGGVAEI